LSSTATPASSSTDLEDLVDPERLDRGLEELRRLREDQLAVQLLEPLGRLDEIAQRRGVDELQEAQVEDQMQAPLLDQRVDLLADLGEVERVELAGEGENGDVAGRFPLDLHAVPLWSLEADETTILGLKSQRDPT
jgi:hypothetical protein